MDETELRDNFFDACLTYAITNNVVPENNNFVELVDDGNGIEIRKWNIDEKVLNKPTEADLMQFTVDEVKQTRFGFYFAPESLAVYSFYQMSSAERDMIPTYKLSTGMSFFNITENKLQIYINGVWKYISIC